MVEAGNIEALAFHFTAGAAAGALLLHLFPAPYALSGGVFLAVALLVAAVLRTGRSELLFPAFLLCGVCCVLTDSFPLAAPPAAKATGAAVRLRALIDRIPFPSDGTAPLLKALLTGDRSGLSRETVQAFRDSGASHLLALSGLHMGILYLLLSRLLQPLGNSIQARRFRFAVLVGGAGGFTLMTGASPSLVRAFLFIVLGETARLTGRPSSAGRTLATALFLQLVLTPSAITSVGFQLSYLAMAGITLLYPRLAAWYPEGSRLNPLRRIWQAAALSLSCQVFTGPLAWYRFHTFPRFFLLTNLLALPLTTLLVWSAVATLLLSAPGCCPSLLVEVTDWLCQTLLSVLGVIASL